MGFKRKRKVYRLDFSDTEYEGLEVRVRGLTTGEYLDVVGLAATSTDENSGETDAMLKLFARHLVAWNLEDEDGNPVPATYEGIKSNDLSMNLRIVNAWTDAIASVSEDVEKKSLTGVIDSPTVVNIPTEVL